MKTVKSQKPSVYAGLRALELRRCRDRPLVPKEIRSTCFRSFLALSAPFRSETHPFRLFFSTVSVCSVRVCGINCGQAKHPECSFRRIRGVFVVRMVTLVPPKKSRPFAKQILPRSRQRKIGEVIKAETANWITVLSILI